MAGIGFELYKILHEGTLSSVLKAFLLGTIIVAGPWILSILCIYSIQKFAFLSIAENPALFTVTIVYTYAASLFLFGGVHYVFSRYIADRLYETEMDKTPAVREQVMKKITSALVTVMALVILLSCILALVFSRLNDFSFITNSGFYTVSLVFLFTVVNSIWILLIYAALLKEYNKIFLTYLAGMAGSLAGVHFLGRAYGVAGALLGYGSGQVLIIVLLLLIAQRSYPLTSFSFNMELFSYFRRFILLFLTGMFFNMAVWADKVIYWFTRGEHIPGTAFYYFTQYDIPVFIAYLTMIPGLVYFLVVSETVFHRNYLDFITTVLSDRLSDILAKKERMAASLKAGLTGLVLFQGVWTAVLVLNRDGLLRATGFVLADPAVMGMLLVAVFFHMLALALQIYMMYFELRREALVSAVIFLAANVLMTLALPSGPLFPPGTGYCAATFLSAAYGVFILHSKVPVIDFIVFNRT